MRHNNTPQIKKLVPILFHIILILQTGVILNSCKQAASPKLVRVSLVVGKAQKVREGKTTALQTGEFLIAGDRITTRANAAVELVVRGQGLVRIGENADLSIEELFKKNIRIRVKKGDSGYFLKKINRSGQFRVVMPTTVGSVRGTKFLARVNEQGESVLALFDGKMELQDEKKPGKALIMDKPGEVKAPANRSLAAETIQPLSPESLATMNKLEEMTRLDIQKSLENAFPSPDTGALKREYRKPGGGDQKIPEHNPGESK